MASTDHTSQQDAHSVVLDAYRRAEETVRDQAPGCHLRWELLAGIGLVESASANGGAVTAMGATLTPIIGPVLDGSRFAAVPDTDGGRLDGDKQWDRAVGPMQFLPASWKVWASDGNQDGQTDPHNIFDAALAAGRYLCTGGRDLSSPADLDAAILSYNRSTRYLQSVKAGMTRFMAGAASWGTPTQPAISASSALGTDFGRRQSAPIASSAGASLAGSRAIAYALAQLGKPYVWGGAGPDAFDCSGLTSQSWAHAGVLIPRTSQEQWAHLQHVALSSIRPGDLVVYFSGATHVALYIGDGKIVQAPRTGDVVKISALQSMPVLGVARPDPNEPGAPPETEGARTPDSMSRSAPTHGSPASTSSLSPTTTPPPPASSSTPTAHPTTTVPPATTPPPTSTTPTHTPANNPTPTTTATSSAAGPTPN